MIQLVKEIITQQFCDSVQNLRQYENVKNNSVFSFLVGDDEYVFKIYRNSSWPEDGKLQFVNQQLLNHQIKCAVLNIFTRDAAEFPCGYLIERKISGVSADRLSLTFDEELSFYRKLARLLSEVHQIQMKGFGYISDGDCDSESMVSFFEDEFDDRTELLVQKGYYTKQEILRMKAEFLETLKCFESLPAVLCHGDLSKKNVIVQDDGELVLIDWDDAMAYNWMADISRLTFWLKMNYSEQEYSLLRNAFLADYSGSRKDEFSVFERAFHVYVALDYLRFAHESQDREIADFAERYILELTKSLH